jgi:cytochrome P450
VFDHTNVILGFTDPEYVDDIEDPVGVTSAILTAGAELAQLVSELGEARIKDPGNDLVSALVTSEVDGEKLSPQELASFFILLVVAGNETTRNAIAHGLWALTQHPDQKQRWLDDIDGLAPTAVEEIVRWASPVIHFRRTVTRDGVRLRDHEFSEGDKVVLWYWSGNRDEAVFVDPHRFDLGRTPNDHIGFGGPGPHFCLGAHLARREVSVMFRELLRRLPDIHAVGEPDRLRSGFINGIKHLPAAWTPVSAGRR